MDEVTLLKALNVGGTESLDVLKLAYANSRFQVCTLAFVASGSILLQAPHS